ncbi:MAG TPA: VOC family protein [Dehalococcoidia bacterium]|nr:VOC family protein [Dehalococcoidia bacterium]
MTHDHHDHEGHDHEHDHEVGPRHFFGVVPVLLVDDVLATVEFYRDALGFEANFLYDNPPTYASVSRNDAIINFALSQPPGRRNGVSGAGPGNGTDLYIVVNDLDDVHEEFKLTGVSILLEPLDTDYGMREFKIEDLNGYQIIFGQEVEEDDDDA